MKYCPKCGAKLSVQDKFCDHCGADVSGVPAAGQNNLRRQIPQMQPAPQAINNQPNMGKRPSKKPQSKIDKNRKIRNNCLIIAACVLFLAAAGMIFFTLQSNNQNADQAAFAQTAKSLGFEKVDKLSPKDTAGLAISYAHMHFKDDPSWDKAFDDAENGDLHIKALPEYEFGDYRVKAPRDGMVYVLDPDTGYVVSDVHNVSNSKVTYISRKGRSKSVFFPTLAKKVSHSLTKQRVQRIVHQVYVGDENGNEIDSDEDESSRDSSSSESNSDEDSNSSDEDVSWSDDKEEELADFMDSFGKKMKQDYEEYNGDDSIKTDAGETYPDDFDDRTFKLYSDDDKDGKKIDIGYDPDLEKDDYDYHVVAIFNADVGNPEQHITYFFCVYDNEPVVLVDQTTNGNDCMVKETDNKDLKSSFAKILTSKDSDSDEDTIDDDDE